METVAWVCEFCNGASGKPRASENSRRCTSNKKPWNCRDALTEARTREREAQGQQGRLKRARVQLQGQPSAYAAIIAEKNIYRIDEVYGVSFFDLDAIREDNVLRNGIEADEHEHQYLVRGLFGDSMQSRRSEIARHALGQAARHLPDMRRGRGHIGARGF